MLIIQHPKEVEHPFNTGKIVALCLSNIELAVTEVLDEALTRKIEKSNSVLLYPDTDLGSTLVDSVDSVDSNLLDSISARNHQEIEQLVVLDASWRKSKRMLFANPCLQKLPRLSLDGCEASQYQIRRTATKGALSTIESVTQALTIIEPNSDFAPLLRPFKRMIQLQLSFKADQ